MNPILKRDREAPKARRWRVPPPLVRGRELLEGADVLRELDGPQGVLLWKTLRNVMLWAETPPTERKALFAPGAGERRLAEILATELEPALEEPLRSLAGVLGAPGEVRTDRVALACRKLAQWAEKNEAAGTALAFTQAAALICPADATLAYAVGRIARARGEHARAESWFRRTIMLGRQTGAWYPYVEAYLSLGSLFNRRGNLPLARRCQIKALRAARRHGLPWLRGPALHDLFWVATEMNDAAAASRYAVQAFRAYGRRHHRIPALAHDVGVFWVERGEFARAVPVLKAVASRIEAPEEHGLVLANLARAAGGAGYVDLFHDAASRVGNVLEVHGSTTRGAQTRMGLARGAASLGFWDLAREHAEHALAIATRTGEARITFEAEAVLEAANFRRSAPSLQPASEPEAAGAGADAFAAELVEALTV